MNLKKIYFFVFFVLSYFILSKTIKDDNDDDFEFEFSFNDKKKIVFFQESFFHAYIN